MGVAIVTGSTKGIGKGIAECLAQAGHSVVITSRDADRAETQAQALVKQGYEAIGVPFNIENRNNVETLIGTAVDHYGRLDVLVNNALSTSAVPDIAGLESEAICMGITSNVSHTLLLTKAAYPYLQKTAGSVVNIGSAVVNRPVLGMVLYSTVKGAILQMTKALAAEWASHNVRVNCINPGFVFSSALEEFHVPQEVINATYKHCEQFHPLGNKIGEPADIGEMVVFLASEKAKMFTGSVINIDAGLAIQGISMTPG